MEKLDLKKELKHLYNPSASAPVLVEVPPFNYIMIDGSGAPDGREAQEAIETLYPVAYALKFMYKKQKDVDYGVMPLEGLWWADDMSKFNTDNKAIWKWTYMIMQPSFITREMYDSAAGEVKKKKNPPAINRIRFEAYNEGKSTQIMHTGPFSEEGPTVAKLHDFIKSKNFKFDGLKQKHHEIYLNDFRKIDPAKMKTVIRQPVVSG